MCPSIIGKMPLFEIDRRTVDAIKFQFRHLNSNLFVQLGNGPVCLAAKGAIVSTTARSRSARASFSSSRSRSNPIDAIQWPREHAEPTRDSKAKFPTEARWKSALDPGAIAQDGSTIRPRYRGLSADNGSGAFQCVIRNIALGHADVLATGSGLGPLLTGFQRRHHLQQRVRPDRDLPGKRSVVSEDQ
jgi:hypothetical protein